MNYVWQELCRQRSALARLMLGSLPGNESAAQTAETDPTEFAGQGFEMEKGFRERGQERDSFSEAETIWTAGLFDGEGRGAMPPPLSADLRSLENRRAAGNGSDLSDWEVWSGAAPMSIPAGAYPGSRMTGGWSEDGLGSSGARIPLPGWMPLEGKLPEAGYRTRGETTSPSWTSASHASGTPDGPQVRMVAEIAEPSARFPAASPAAMSLAFERDARRYDGGFELYP